MNKTPQRITRKACTLTPPGKQPITTLRFYRRDRLATLCSASSHVMLLLSEHVMLAHALSTGTEKNTQLIGQDSMMSCISALGEVPRQTFSYNAYGYRTLESIGLGYTGGYLEPCTAGYMLGNGHRLYSPSLMRFTQADALSPFSHGGINTYAYCGGDPVNRVDPTGRRFSWTGLLKKINPKEKTGNTALLKRFDLDPRTIKNALRQNPTTYDSYKKDIIEITMENKKIVIHTIGHPRSDSFNAKHASRTKILHSENLARTDELAELQEEAPFYFPAREIEAFKTYLTEFQRDFDPIASSLTATNEKILNH